MTADVVALDAAGVTDPYPLYAQWRATGRVTRDRRHDLWVVAGYDEVQSVLRRHDDFSSEVGPLAALHGDPSRAMMIASDPPRHTRLRSAVSHAFRPQAVARWTPRVEAIAAELVRVTARTPRVDAVRALAEPLPVAVIADLLGVPPGERAAFKGWSEEFLAGLNRTDWAAAIEPAWSLLRAWFADALDDRAAMPRDDLISDLARSVGDGPHALERDEAIDLCALLLVAGNETTTNLIANAIAALCDDPDLQARLRRRPDDIPAAVEEILRWDSPVQALFRRATRPASLGSEVIAPSERALVVFASANRDEARFGDADRIDVDRPGPPHVAFGAGRHFCLGAHLARLEASVLLGALLAGTTAFGRDPSRAAQRRATLVVRGWHSLPITVEMSPDARGVPWTSS